MRLTKSLLCITSALALATGAAFAGGDSMSSQSHEAEIWSSEHSSYPLNGSESLAGLEQSDTESFAEADVIYIYPLEVTEMIVLVPSVDSETPQG